METWEHVIKCRETTSLRKDFVTNLLKEMIENQGREVGINEIFEMIEDILRYLENEEDKEYERNQALIGI